MIRCASRSRGRITNVLLFALIAGVIAVTLTFLPRWLRPNTARAGASTRIEVWSWNVAAKGLESTKPGFEKIHPEIDVYINRNGTAMQSRLLLSLSAGVGAPDVTQLQQAETPKFTPTGSLLDLTELAKKHAADFPPAAWSVCQFDGKTYAIPWDIGPCGVFYRRSIMAKYGIDVDAIETWDDYIEAGKRVAQGSGGKTMMLTLPTADLNPTFSMIVQQNGGGVFDAQGRLILNQPRNREVLELLRKMLDAKICAPMRNFTNEYFASFGDDSVASYPIAVWMMDNMKEYAPKTAGDWGVFRLPAMRPGGLRASNMGGSSLSIPTQSTRAPQAWAFIEYALCTVEGQVKQYESYGLFPAYLPALKDPYFDKPDPFFGGQKIHRLFATDIEKVPAVMRTRDWNDADRIIRQRLSAWAEQRQDNEAFLRDTQKALSIKLDREIAPESEGASRP